MLTLIQMMTVFWTYADVFEAALDGNVNDGFIVNEGITPLDGTLPDVDMKAMHSELSN